MALRIPPAAVRWCRSGALDLDQPARHANAPGPVNLAPDLMVSFYNAGTVLYAGGAPTLPCGVVQINMQISLDIQPGAIALAPYETISAPTGTVIAETYLGSIIYVK
jgi:hypothetical protein